MRKLIIVIAIALVVATGLWIALRIRLANQLATVPELLPKNTLLLLEAPDLKRTRDRWHASDLYQIWRESAVQSLLQKPLGRVPANRAGREVFDEFLQLDPTHSFVALISLENNEPKLIGGFHFGVSPEKARAFVEKREATWWPKVKNAKRETISYEQHQIEEVRVSRFVFARVFEQNWFFASNELRALQALLDRADHRANKQTASLQENEAFLAARKHLRSDYAAVAFVDPQPFVQRLLPLIAMTGQSLPSGQVERLKSIRSVAAALGFEKGKMRETDFVAMPRIGAEKKLSRPLLAAAGVNTFFYSASRMYWPDNIFSASAPGATGLAALIQQFNTAMQTRGISGDDLRQAFGDELEIAGAWPIDARGPTIVAALPVADPLRARKVIDALVSVELAGTAWVSTKKDSATIFSTPPFGGLVPLSLNLALGDKMMFFATDSTALESTMSQMGRDGGELQKSEQFRSATGQLPPGNCAFNYVDTRLLCERINASLRPLVVVGATLYPALGKSIDLSKLPPPKVIAKHLSPIVMSQRYEEDGYVTESLGPVTFREGAIGVAAVIGSSLFYLREGLKTGGLLPGIPALTAPTPAPSPSPTPLLPSATPSPSPSPI